MTINDKPWIRARKVCRVLEYGKATKTADIVKHLCSQENYAPKCQLTGFVAETNLVNWPKDSQKYDIYINKEGMCEVLFASQQLKVKDFRKHCCNVLFPHVRQQITNRLEEDHQQAIIGIQRGHQLAIIDRYNKIQAIQHENVALQVQRDVYQTQLQQCQIQIHDLIINRHVPRSNDPGKDNIVMIFEKNTTPEEDEFYEYPYYIARIQRRFINARRRWFRAQYLHHRFIVEELDNANSIHIFKRFEEEGHVERFLCHFRLVDLARNALYALGTPTIHE